MLIAGTSTLVAGGASGLGAATARLLAGAGGRVAVVDRDRILGEKLALKIGGLFVEADVRRAATIDAALSGVARAHGPPRIVVNCAGIGGGGIATAGKRGPHPVEVLESMLDVHVIGTFNVCRLAAAAMLIIEPGSDGERGVIVNTSSAAAQDGPAGMTAYAAAKGAIEAMTLPMARDLGPWGIRVCCIVPGTFDTPLAAALPDDLKQRVIGMNAFPQRLGEPADFAGLVRHLIENPMMNGVNVRIDAGLRLGIGR